MRRARLLAILLVASCACAQQPMTSRQSVPSAGFALDSGRPYLEIAFERAGPRIPVMPGESSQGVWLRFRNNCPYPVQLPSLSAEQKNEGALIQFDVVDITPVDRPAADGRPVADKPPAGYREFSHTPRVVEVPPGEDLVFSVTREVFTFNTVMRVQALILVPTFAGKETPLTFVEFSWRGLPPEVVRSLSR